MTGGLPLADATLTGNAVWIAGSDKEVGTVTLLSKGTGESRMDLTLSDGPRTEIRNDSGAYPQGASAGVDGKLEPAAMHNCWNNASWFFPSLSFLSATSDPTLVFAYVGQENRYGITVEHIQVYRYLTAKRESMIDLTRVLSMADFYLDAASLLPVAIVFNGHPDDDALTNIAMEVDFYNYQAIDGIQVPMHIQKLISNGLALDVAFTGAAFNTGLSDSFFAVQ